MIENPAGWKSTTTLEVTCQGTYIKLGKSDKEINRPEEVVNYRKKLSLAATQVVYEHIYYISLTTQYKKQFLNPQVDKDNKGKKCTYYLR